MRAPNFPTFGTFCHSQLDFILWKTDVCHPDFDEQEFYHQTVFFQISNIILLSLHLKNYGGGRILTRDAGTRKGPGGQNLLKGTDKILIMLKSIPWNLEGQLHSYCAKFLPIIFLA